MKLANWFWRRRFKNFIYVFLLFRNCLLPLEIRWDRLFEKKKLNPLNPSMICVKFGWNWFSGSGEEDENVKSLWQRQHQRWRTTVKYSSEKLRWARNYRETVLFSCFIIVTVQIHTCNEYLISTIIVTKSTLQASHEACGLVSWYRSLGLDKLNNFCSVYLNKIFTRKTLLPSTNIDKNRLYRRAMRPMGLFLILFDRTR